MAPSLTSTGLVIDTVAGLQAQFTQDAQTVYGQDINLGSDTPDGQMLGNFIQSAIDNEEVVEQVFNGFDPDNAIGVVLDQRCAINNIQRQMGTYTETNVAITFSSTATLYGLDQTNQPVFTVTDNAGSVQWQLVETVTKTAGTYELAFQSATIGAVLTIPGTITVPVTVNLAVTAINNDQPYSSLGTAQESDAQLKIRRQQSVAIASQGYYSALNAELQNISGVGVGNVRVYENDTAATSTGTVPPNVPANIPSHSIYVVVGGGSASESQIGGTAGANAEAIATAIYQKRNAGCGMFGDQSYAITQADSTLFPIFWDIIEEVPLFIKFTVGSINGTSYPNISAIVNALTGLPATFLPGINQTVNVNTLTTLVQQIDPNTYVSSPGYSISAGGVYTSTLQPSAGNDQFQVSGSNIIITPMIMTSSTSVVSITQGIPIVFSVTDNAIHSGGTGSTTLTFLALGGYGSITYSISVNNSGATIGGSSGIYSPGPSSAVFDTILATDGQSNTATVVVSVA